MLAVVEHDETLTVRQRCGELVERRLIRVDVYEARRGDCGGEVDATVDGSQIDEEGPTRPARLLAAGDLDGQAGLAHAAGAGERQQSTIEEQATHGRDVVVTADEGGALGRKVRRRDVERAGRREVGRERRPEYLEQRDRTGDVAESMIPASIDARADRLRPRLRCRESVRPTPPTSRAPRDSTAGPK